MRGGALFKGKEGRGDFRKNSTVGRLHPRFLRKRGLGRIGALLAGEGQVGQI